MDEPPAGAETPGHSVIKWKRWALPPLLAPILLFGAKAVGVDPFVILPAIWVLSAIGWSVAIVLVFRSTYLGLLIGVPVGALGGLAWMVANLLVYSLATKQMFSMPSP